MEQKSPTIEVTFTTLTYGGDALGRLPDGRAVFAPFVLPGERARVRLVEEKRGHARGVVEELLEASPRRIVPRCVHFGFCGGCHYQNLSYADQLQIKQGIVADQLTRLGGIENPPVRPVIPDPRGWDYRNTVQFHLTPEGKVGYQRFDTAQPFAIQECHLLEDALDPVWQQLDFEAVPGLERVALRLGAGDDVLLTLEGSDPTPPEMTLDMDLSVVHTGPAGSIVLAGDDFVIMEVLGRLFRVSAGSFFQVNTLQAARMVTHVLERLSPLPLDAAVMDLYCGAGLFSAFLAPRAARLIGVEVSPSACADFAANLDEFDNVELYQGTAEQVLPALDVRPGAVMVDPPRAGLERAALDALVRLAPPVLVYVSCDPATLARDLKRLLAAGYTLEETQPFDLFPQTYHIESISLLRR